ncbi:hypothetical protein IFM89_029959 [Coptis chinensis]|uniref:Delta(14)-sterol reductase n=1 Tax=Coptis chinensis TaxID=261450 RepID=A0A835HG17_9MAGN|nr:hypothetical protein IFM89_029959 [Coptis chinensis]
MRVKAWTKARLKIDASAHLLMRPPDGILYFSNYDASRPDSTSHAASVFSGPSRPIRLGQVTLALYVTGRQSRAQGSSLIPYVTGSLIHDWWFGIQLNPHFIGIDLKFIFVRAGMMGWLFINLSVLAKSIQDGSIGLSMILYQIFCVLYILDYFFYEEYMTSTSTLCGVLESINLDAQINFHVSEYGPRRLIKLHHSLLELFTTLPNPISCFTAAHTFLGWWLLSNKVELTKAAAIANCLVFLIGGVAKHCNYLGDLLVALSFSLPCGASSPVPYFYPLYLFILLIWRERRDEARCAEKYKEIWAEYCKIVPWRILPYVY